MTASVDPATVSAGRGVASSATPAVMGDPGRVRPGVLDRLRRRVEDVPLVGQLVVDAEPGRGSAPAPLRTPDSRTVTPRASSRLIVSARTDAPVASSDATRDIRRTTTRTSLTSETSSRKAWAAPKNSGPSSR